MRARNERSEMKSISDTVRAGAVVVTALVGFGLAAALPAAGRTRRRTTRPRQHPYQPNEMLVDPYPATPTKPTPHRVALARTGRSPSHSIRNC